MLKGISLKNFKCFKDEYIELENVTLLSGINGMGKSTLIQSILLLRQSYEEKVIDRGVSLNGNMVQIGTGKDLLYEKADEPEEIEIELEYDEIDSINCKIEYESTANFLNFIESNIGENLDKINIFSDRFEYISAERIGPKNIFEKSNYDVVEHRSIGIRGEYVQHYLAIYGREDIKNKYAKLESKEELDLISQTEGWIDLISPGIKLVIQDLLKADLMTLHYRIVNTDVSNEYRTTNVGFGITYVLPVIVALLKAKEGDIVIIENPEAHIHPRGQRILGELISRVAAGNVQVIIESHSDHILNGIRLSVRHNLIDKEKIKLNFFERKIVNNNYVHIVETPNIKDDGRLDYWPKGFFDEWDRALDEMFD